MSTEKEALVSLAVSKITSGKLTEKQLVAYFDNVHRSADVSELQRESVAEAVEAQLRKQFPVRAKRMFGKVDQAARTLLGALLQSTKSEFDLSANRVKTSVKTGGDQLRGDFLVDTYISYKSADDRRALIEIRQQDAVSASYVVVEMLNVSSRESLARHQFELSEFDRAATLYKGMVGSLLHPA